MPGPFFITKTNDDNSTENEDRNREFENTIGNLLVAEFQVHKLRQRMLNYHMATKDNSSSDFMYKYGDAWFRISITAERYSLPEKEKDDGEEEMQQEQPQFTDEQSTGFAP